MLCDHGETERHIRILYSGKFTVHFLYESHLESYYNLLEQDVVMCVTFALEKNYLIDTVTIH